MKSTDVSVSEPRSSPDAPFVFQIYTGCYDGSLQAVKMNLLQTYRCWVRQPWVAQLGAAD